MPAVLAMGEGGKGYSFRCGAASRLGQWVGSIGGSVGSLENSHPPPKNTNQLSFSGKNTNKSNHSVGSTVGR